MKTKELEIAIANLIPGASIEKDNYGQIVIYTGLMIGLDDELVDFLESNEDQ